MHTVIHQKEEEEDAHGDIIMNINETLKLLNYKILTNNLTA